MWDELLEQVTDPDDRRFVEATRDAERAGSDPLIDLGDLIDVVERLDDRMWDSAVELWRDMHRRSLFLERMWADS